MGAGTRGAAPGREGSDPAERGWTMPLVSSHGTSFADDCGAGGGFQFCMFLRDADEIYLTYRTGSRGVDRLLFSNNIRDLSAWGRQKDWGDSPPAGRSTRPTADSKRRPAIRPGVS
ncbi:DUF899 family protein [Actinoplanes sp. NPDC026619]|uniref:DUF899 family protein n=1 Tax=Actinoplanes sp. NPDC026619 TaxID=3155798 RepID=UPI0033DCF30E